jgi:uncharacterized membrane protein
MSHESLVNEDRSQGAATLRRPFGLVDLACGAGLAAMLAMAVSAIRESDLSRMQVDAFGLLTLLLLVMQRLIWRLELLAARRSRPRGRAAPALTLAASVTALASLIVLASLSPGATLFDILACISFALYLRGRE